MLLEMEIYECDGDDLRETIWRSSIYSLYLFFLKIDSDQTNYLSAKCMLLMSPVLASLFALSSVKLQKFEK